MMKLAVIGLVCMLWTASALHVQTRGSDDDAVAPETEPSLEDYKPSNEESDYHCVNAKIKVKPEHRELFLSVVQANADGSNTWERGTRQYSWGEMKPGPDAEGDSSETNVFIIHEEYESEGAMQYHSSTEYFQRWQELAEADAFDGPPELSQFRCKPAQHRGPKGEHYANPDQVARFTSHKARNEERVLDINSVYDYGGVDGKRVLVTGADKGLGLALTKQLLEDGAIVTATCRHATDELKKLSETLEEDNKESLRIIENADVTKDEDMKRMAGEVSEPLDVVINNAGYFYGPVETLDTLNFAEETKMIQICALGPIRVTSALRAAGKLKKNGGKVVVITSQGGSVDWRTTQNPEGHDYGHHMSKAAANMGARLLSQELKPEGISVGILHPGFVRTDMTRKYAEIWDREGAVEKEVAAKRVLHEVNELNMETTGNFVNCEDGRMIPF